MTLTRESEQLLADMPLLGHGLSLLVPDTYALVRERLEQVEAAVRAEQAAEVERLREALAEAMGWLERSDREQNVHQFRHGMSMLRAALAVDPAVAPAPDPAPPAPGERCGHVCADSRANHDLGRTDHWWQDVNPFQPEPAP